jgi:hypothetical protein
MKLLSWNLRLFVSLVDAQCVLNVLQYILGQRAGKKLQLSTFVCGARGSVVD